jgi:hypothetical protein
MTYRTIKEAAAFTCPIARVSGDEPTTSQCKGAKCAWWYWRMLPANDPRVLTAMEREMALLKAERPKAIPANLTNEAFKRVMADTTAFTFPDPAVDKGYCGAAGRPE